MTHAKQAVQSFKEGFNCAQAVLSAFAAEKGLDPSMARRVAGAFGGGMGRMAGTCGAVIGAFMVIGLAHAKTRADEDEEKEKGYALVREFVRRFTTRHESTECRVLLGCDIGTLEGMEYAAKAGLFTTRCPKFVHAAAEILDELFDQCGTRLPE